tara:strand:+ start:349 stop:759 length:411 start_codon:yes stop_codon:yes gene_type:complete
MSQLRISNERLCEKLIEALPDVTQLVEVLTEKPVSRAYHEEETVTFYADGMFGQDSMTFNLTPGHEKVTVTNQGYDQAYVHTYSGERFNKLRASGYATLIIFYERTIEDGKEAREPRSDPLANHPLSLREPWEWDE